MLIKYTCDLKLQILIMHALPVPVYWQTDGWSFRVYMIPLQDFVPELSEILAPAQERG